MSKKDTIIDPEWEKDNELRGKWKTRPRPQPQEPDELDPFGVDSAEQKPRFEAAEQQTGEEEWTLEQNAGPRSVDRNKSTIRENEAGAQWFAASHDTPPFDPDPAAKPNPHAGFSYAGKQSSWSESESQTEPQPDPFTEREKEPVSHVGSFLGSILSGSILTRSEVRRSYPYMILLAVLMLLYISNLFRMQQLHRREIELTRQVKELRATSLELASKRMSLTRRSVMLDELTKRGIPLEEPMVPPQTIKNKAD